MIDGFTLNAHLRHASHRFFGLAVDRLSELRRSADHTFRWYCVPEDPLRSIDPYDTLLYQVRMQPASVWWGVSFAATTGSSADFLLQISDGVSRKPYFSSPVAAGMFVSSNVTRLRPVLLGQPTIVESGHLNVGLSNLSASSVVGQLLLWVSEPQEASA